MTKKLSIINGEYVKVLKLNRSTYTTTLRWCKTHEDVAWVYSDGSVQCMLDLILETSSEAHETISLDQATETVGDFEFHCGIPIRDGLCGVCGEEA